ncbi:MAG: ABC transporter permease, partial [Thermoanaerobaculia bacterium]
MMFLSNIAYALRHLRKNLFFSGIVIFCLAVGIGANTALFSVADLLFLRALPYKDPDRIMMLWDTYAGAAGEVETFSAAPANFDAWKKGSTSFEALEAIQLKSYNLTSRGEPLRVEGAAVSHGFFRLFGVQPLHGRSFSPEEDRPGGPLAVMLSHGLWQRQFQADLKVLGSSVLLDDEPYVIVGVMPPEFRFPHASDLWTPLALDPLQAPARTFHTLYVAGRLGPEASLEQAQQEIQTIA